MTQKRKTATKPKDVDHIKDLVPDPANRRLHNPRNIGMVVDALHQVGAARSIVIDEDDVILAGNGVTEAAAEAGITKVRVIETDGRELIAVRRRGLSEEQKRALAIYDNRTGELASWDFDQLAADKAAGLSLQPFWTAEEETALLEKQAPKDGLTDPDEVPAQRPTDIQIGDLFELGKRRLLCGDSTNAETVGRLMNGAKADLVFTSPPYGQQRDYGQHISDWQALMRGVFSHLPTHDTTQVLVNLGLIHRDGEWMPYWEPWIEWMREQRWRRFGWYVWDQGHGLPGDWNGRLAPSHEFLFHFNKAAKVPQKIVATKPASLDRAESKRRGAREGKVQQGLRDKSGVVKPLSSLDTCGQLHKIPDSVVRITREQARGIHTQNHPAVFPVALPRFIAETWPGDIYEPFCGSGTTLIAGEQITRQCFALEIDPGYCQVIIDRWEAFTGQKAVKVGETVAV